MAHYSDWLPPNRTEQLIMGKNWLKIIPPKKDSWKIPQEALQVLAPAVEQAEQALEEAQNESSRTPVATAKCKEAFDAMIEALRDIKRRYLYNPPLSDADLIALGLKPKDTTHSPSGIPTAQAMLETYLVGRHELGVKIIYVTGNREDPANKGYRIYYSVLNQGETPPENPEALRKSFYTKRIKDVIAFDFNDSGKTAYLAVQIENGGKKGPWGQIVHALIP